MNFVTLLQQHPLLRADLENLGLSHNRMQDAAAEISGQLGGEAQYNLCYVISGLSCKEFVRRIDTTSLAKRINITPSLAQSVILVMAPWVDQFQLQSV